MRSTSTTISAELPAHSGKWIQCEEFCNSDMLNHSFLTDNFFQIVAQRQTSRSSFERQDNGRLVDPGEWAELQDAVGEDIAELEETSEDDHANRPNLKGENS